MTTLNQPSTAFTRSLANSNRAVKVAAVVFGSLLIAAASQIEVPFFPVPMTMQDVCRAAGRPVVRLPTGRPPPFSSISQKLRSACPVLSGAGNIATLFVKPATAGYLVGFVGAAFVAGLIVERTAGRLWGVVAAAVAGEVVLMSLGVAFLASMIGAESAFKFGFLPFILGDVLKIVLAVAVARGVGRLSLPATH